MQVLIIKHQDQFPVKKIAYKGSWPRQLADIEGGKGIYNLKSGGIFSELTLQVCQHGDVASSSLHNSHPKYNDAG